MQNRVLAAAVSKNNEKNRKIDYGEYCFLIISIVYKSSLLRFREHGISLQYSVERSLLRSHKASQLGDVSFLSFCLRFIRLNSDEE